MRCWGNRCPIEPCCDQGKQEITTGGSVPGFARFYKSGRYGPPIAALLKGQANDLWRHCGPALRPSHRPTDIGRFGHSQMPRAANAAGLPPVTDRPRADRPQARSHATSGPARPHCPRCTAMDAPWRRTAPRRRWRALAPSCAGAPCAGSGWPDDTKFCPPPGRTMERCSSCPHARPQGPMAIGPASCLHPPVSAGGSCCPGCVPLFLSGSPCPLHLSALAASALSTARTEHGPP